MKTNLLIILSMLLLATTSLQAQSPHLAALSKPGKTCIELRWAPLNFEAWQQGIKNGYVIERSTILRNGKVLEPIDRKILTPNPIKIADKDIWANYENDNYAMIAGECIFGENETQQTDFLPLRAYKRRQDEERRFGFALFSADMSEVLKMDSLFYITN